MNTPAEKPLCENDNCTRPATNELYQTDGKGNILRIKKVCAECFMGVWRNSILR